MALQIPTGNPRAPVNSEPPLPVEKAFCPGDGRVVSQWRIAHQAALYSSWKADHIRNGSLKRGELVTVLKGVSVTRKPARILVIRDIPDLSLKSGDTILRYDHFGEMASIWANGAWHRKYDVWRTVELDGGGCGARNACDSKVIESGRNEWWVQVRTSQNRTGWTAGHNGNFDELCGD